jgi:hypothetical protein
MLPLPSAASLNELAHANEQQYPDDVDDNHGRDVISG